MSAVLRDRPDRYAMDGMRLLLKRWGSVCELVRNWNSYPTVSASWRDNIAAGGARCPLPDVPSIVIQVNHYVLKLPDENMNAITIAYAWQLNPGGGWWDWPDKALALGINEHTLRSRERRGREILCETAGHLMP